MSNPRERRPLGVDRRFFTRRGVLKSMVVTGGAVAFAGFGKAPKIAAQDQVTLTQWVHQYGETGVEDAVRRYAEQYTEANPNIAIEINWVTGDYGAALNTALVGGTAPDVFEVGTQPSLDMVRQRPDRPARRSVHP